MRNRKQSAREGLEDLRNRKQTAQKGLEDVKIRKQIDGEGTRSFEKQEANRSLGT